MFAVTKPHAGSYLIMGKKRKGFIQKVGGTILDVYKVPREALRILDQTIELANDLTERSGIAKHMSGSSRVGASASSGSRGGYNLNYQANARSPILGVGIGNNGTPAVFVNNQTAINLAPRPIDFAIPANDDAPRSIDLIMNY